MALTVKGLRELLLAGCAGLPGEAATWGSAVCHCNHRTAGKRGRTEECSVALKVKGLRELLWPAALGCLDSPATGGSLKACAACRSASASGLSSAPASLMTTCMQKESRWLGHRQH